MDLFYAFGPARVVFRDFPRNGNWPFWEWKPSPWTVSAGEFDLEVCWDTAGAKRAGTFLIGERTSQADRAYYLQSDGALLWQHTELSSGRVLLQLLLEENGKRIRITCDETKTFGIAAFEAVTFLIFYALLRCGVLCFHGALVESEGKGFCLCAPSGEGKTTHAGFWREKKKALILNGDRATCFFDNDRLIAFGTPWCGTSGEALCRSVPLKAVVVLRRGTENRVRPVTGARALDLVLPNLAYPAREAETTLLALELLDRVLEKVPCFLLECTPDAEAAEVLDKALKEGFYGND